jgi:NAD-dependent SIR2 family protein deacetylase
MGNDQLDNMISRWSDFGMNYRGRWVPTNIYDEKDVVWIDLDEEKTVGKYNDGVFICVGTSGNVQPAASLIALFSQVKKKYIVNKESRRIGDYEIVEGLATEGMRMLEQKL